MRTTTTWTRIAPVILAATLFTAGCPAEKGPSAGAAAPAAKAATVPAARAAGEAAAVPAAAASSPAPDAASHDPAHPPIDCPLRKQGLDPTHLRPFEEVEEYIAFLERPDRAEWQRPDAVVTALGLQGHETVYDLGAGSGYFTFRFARAVPRGRVVAGDTEPEMVRHIHHQAMTKGVANVEAKVIQPADPAVPGDADVVFVCDVLHHVGDRPAWLRTVAQSMKPGARLVLVEFKEGALPQGPPEAAKIPRDRLVALGAGAGLTLAAERADLLPYQVFLVFEKPEPGPAAAP